VAEVSGWVDVRAEAERLLAAVQLAGCTEVTFLATGPHLLLAVVERLWQHGITATVVLDTAAASPELTALLASGRVEGQAARGVLEACHLADRVVLAEGTPAAAVTLVSTFGPQVGGVRVEAEPTPSSPPAELALTGSPQLTVLVTTYDRPEALARCLEALCASTLPVPAYEVVVVDDGSPRPAAPVVARFHDRLDLRLLALPANVGLGAARTRGLDEARTGITLLLDDDDEVHPRCLEEHLLAHQEHPQEGVAVLGATAVLPDGRMSALSRHVTTIGRQYFAYPIVRSGQLHTWRAFWGGRSSAKTSLLRRHGFLAPFMEDADFALRARDEGLSVLYAKRALQVVTDRLTVEDFRRRQNRIGHAMLDLALKFDDPDVWTWAGMAPVTANLTRWAAERDAVDDIITTLLHRPVDELRATPHGAATLLQLLDQALLVDLDAHYAAGMLASLARRRAATQSRPLRLAARADDPGLVAAATALAGAAGIELVVVADSQESGELVAGLLERSLPAPLLDEVSIEIRVSGPLEEERDLDLVLPGSATAWWRPGLPVPLIGQGVAAWIEQLSGADGPRGSLR